MFHELINRVLRSFSVLLFDVTRMSLASQSEHQLCVQVSEAMHVYFFEFLFLTPTVFISVEVSEAMHVYFLSFFF